jgi:hypothetical protein
LKALGISTGAIALGGVVDAQLVEAAAPGSKWVFGKVKVVPAPDAMILATAQGDAAITLGVPADVTRAGRGSAALTDFQVGEEVVARGDSIGSGLVAYLVADYFHTTTSQLAAIAPSQLRLTSGLVASLTPQTRYFGTTYGALTVGWDVAVMTWVNPSTGAHVAIHVGRLR